jgi:hypothetical protein
MTPTLLYLLKAHVVLALFAAAYYGLLRQLTFFGLNRAYLVLALLFAAVYPALPVPALLPAVAFEPIVASLGQTGGVGAAPGAAPSTMDWQNVGLVAYACGTGLLLLRLLAQLISLAWVRRNSQPALALGQPVRLLAGAGGPFSFGQTIYLSAAALADTANLPAALRHEQAHVRQWHTLDVLLTQVAVALAWVNPAAWLLRRAVLDNLEYLADQAALQTGLDRRAYQYSLLRQQPGGVPAPALAFHFSFLTLKNRITMLNQPVSTSRQLGRYLLAAPLVMALALGYSAARAQTSPLLASTSKAVPANLVYYLDGQQVDKELTDKVDPATMVSYISVLKPTQQQQVFGNTAEVGAIIITTKANANSPAVLALDEKIERVAPRRTEKPVEVNVLVPKTLAYITNHYPDARLSGKVTEQKMNSSGAVQYQVQLVKGKRPFYVYFTPEGDFLSE